MSDPSFCFSYSKIIVRRSAIDFPMIYASKQLFHFVRKMYVFYSCIDGYYHFIEYAYYCKHKLHNTFYPEPKRFIFILLETKPFGIKSTVRKPFHYKVNELVKPIKIDSNY